MSKLWRKPLSIFSITIIAAMLLAACGGAATTPTQAPPAGGQQTQPPATTTAPETPQATQPAGQPTETAAPAPTQATGGATGEVKNPGTMIETTIGDPESLDPAWAYDTASGEVIFNVYETLDVYLPHPPGRQIPGRAGSHA
jgi:hypothetical protein